MIIQSKKVWIADQFTPAQLELEDGIIKEIYPYNEKEVTKDYGDLRILPGFIDIHCHGAYGFDTNDADPGGLRQKESLMKELLLSLQQLLLKVKKFLQTR